MKNLFKVIFSCVILVAFVIIVTKTMFIQSIFSVIFSETQDSEESFEEHWYYTQLTETEREIYLKIASVVEKYETKVVEIGDDTLSANHASRAYEAYLLDNPAVFYISSEYEINELHVLNVTKLEINLKYTCSQKEIEIKKQALNQEINRIISEIVTPEMTEFEKEVALHDYLVENIEYYDYTDINDIPAVKHNAYGALVQKEAVCDGIAKAYSLLLDKSNITNTVVTGSINFNHAWNKVLIKDSWYNVDVTSDACGEGRVLSHVYFNLSDEEIAVTHVFDTTFSTPKCSSQEYNYYEYNDFKLAAKDFFTDKIRNIINWSNSSSLEFKVSEDLDIHAVVQELYNLNFNNYKTNKVNKIDYFYTHNILIVQKNN